MVLFSETVEPSIEGHGPAPPAHGRERGTRSAEEIWETIHATYPEPDSAAPSAVEIIRADRDGR